MLLFGLLQQLEGHPPCRKDSYNTSNIPESICEKIDQLVNGIEK